MEINLIFLLLIAGVVGAAAGLVGSFMVLKRMSLVGDALSHVALPGMAIALTFKFPPMIGAFLALFIAVIGIWYLEKKSKLYPEALVGIFFTASLAIGLLLTPEPELLEALFGNIEKITFVEGIFAIFFSIILIISAFLISKKILLGIISEDLAITNKIDVSRVNFIYLLMVGMTVAIGVKFIGTLLMGALVIIPAVSAKNISGNLKNYFTLSLVLGLLSTIIGLLIATYLSLSPGPIVVLTSIFFFLLTFFFKKS